VTAPEPPLPPETNGTTANTTAPEPPLPPKTNGTTANTTTPEPPLPPKTNGTAANTTTPEPTLPDTVNNTVPIKPELPAVNGTTTGACGGLPCVLDRCCTPASTLRATAAFLCCR
jgi:hypothetical protein